MTVAHLGLTLRRANLDDAAGVADLYTATHPEEPEDPIMSREWWETSGIEWTWERYVAEGESGALVAIAAQGHPDWSKMPERYARLQWDLAPDVRTPARLDTLAAFIEERARADGALRLSSWVWADDAMKLEVARDRGYVEERRQRHWELDLRAERGHLAAMAEGSRERMSEQNVEVTTLDRVDDPEKLRKIWRMSEDAAQDIPTTVPHVEEGFESFLRWFASPALRDDRIWVARKGEDLVGISMLAYPPARGIVTTDWTGTARSVRGQGVARALKLETVMQAVGLGVDRVRTDNDFRNAPILHLNESMGYRLRKEMIQLLKDA